MTGGTAPGRRHRPARNRLQFGGGQVDDPGRVGRQLRPLGVAEAVAEVLVLPRTNDRLDGHGSLLSRTMGTLGCSRVHFPPLLVARRGWGRGPASGVVGSIGAHRGRRWSVMTTACP